MNPHYSEVVSGEIAGTTSTTAATQRMPDRPLAKVYFKAASDNAGNVYIGRYNPDQAVTVPDGSTDATSGFPLEPGEVSPVFLVGNLNLLARICDNAGDDLHYIGER